MARSAAPLAIAACAAMSGCGKDLPRRGAESGAGPVAAVSAHGAGGLSTKNTTRLGGSSAVLDAAAVAVAVYPGLTPATRPRTVVLVDSSDWLAALAASTLAGYPLHAPLLYSDGATLPEDSALALATMAPTGTASPEGAQTIRVGATATSGYRTLSTATSADPATMAVEVERLASAVRGHAPREVIVTAEDGPPAMTMPAAGLAAQSGAPILFVKRAGVPQVTAAELERLGLPSIYVVGPRTVVSERALGELKRFGTVTRIAGADPASNAVAVARFSNGTFGWGVVEPGHGLVFANARRPLDGPAAAPLSATGDYGPLLVVENPAALPSALTAYLGDLQPGTPPSGPVHGVYNHGWLIGDESAISASMQARIDAILEIAPREAPEPAIAAQGATAEEPTATTGP